MRSRKSTGRKKRIGAWRAEQTPQAAARKVRYVGSAEHKDYPSCAGPPALRRDATPCEHGVDFAHIGGILRYAIRRGCIGEEFEQGFPKYVWGWLKGSLYEARLVNAPMGTYKAYRLGQAQYPDDPDKLLDWKTK